MFGFCPLFAALYPLTQLYQFEEDQARGDRTFALLIGLRRSLQFAFAAMLIAFALFVAGLALRASAWWPLIVIPFIAWTAVLGIWYVRCDRFTPAQHKRGMYAALNAWAITDIAVLAIFLL